MDGLTIFFASGFLFIMFLIYREINRVSSLNYQNGEQLKQVLVNINSSIRNLIPEKQTDAIDSLFKIPNMEDLKQKKESLIRMYADYLRKSNLSYDTPISKEDSVDQAIFEINKFGIKSVLENMDWDILLKDENPDESFTKTSHYKNEMKNYWTSGSTETGERWVMPGDLLSPVIGLIKNSNYAKGKKFFINPNNDKTYYDFISNRAKVYNLIKLGIISDVTEKDANNGVLKYILNINNIKDIAKIVYKNCPGNYNLNDFNEKDFDDEVDDMFEIENS